MLKAAHEMRAQGSSTLPSPITNQERTGEVANRNAIVKFVCAWSDFIPFYSRLFSIIQREQMEKSDKSFLECEIPEEIPQWHVRRDQLKELLFRVTEKALVVQGIPDWERLRQKSSYVTEGRYRTPFSFILDFVDPYHMVSQHGDDLWAASFISQEFLDYLSFKYDEVKEVWRTNA